MNTGINFSTELAKKVEFSDNNNKYLAGGIHENVLLESVRTDVSPNAGRRFIEFKFIKDNKTFTHTEWAPIVSTETKEDAEKSQSKVTNQVTRINRILNCFFAKELLNFDGTSYEDFANWVVRTINLADKSVLLRVKVVYNKDGFTQLPSYVKFACIEPMNIPMGYYKEGENASKIKEIEGIDLFIRPVTEDKEAKVTNPLDMPTQKVASTTNVDDLPF